MNNKQYRNQNKSDNTGETGLNFSRCIPLAKHTTFRIGGPADLFINVRSIKKMSQVVDYACKNGIPFLVIGKGSNLLVCDRGIRGLVIRNCIRGIRKDGDFIIARAGEEFSSVVEFARMNCLTGLEFASGIPGTVGGAVYGNAGAYGKAIGDILISAKVMKRDGRIIEADQDYFGFRYRWSRLKETGEILLEVKLKLEQGYSCEIESEIERIKEERKGKHPSKEWGCAGSYFKNIDPEKPGERRIAAGLLLDRVGAKGTKNGSAVVYPGHANFLTNPGGATCREILELAALLKEKVKNRFGIELEEEVMFIGEDPERFRKS